MTMNATFFKPIAARLFDTEPVRSGPLLLASTSGPCVLAVPGSELCHQIDENTLSDIVDVGDVIRYIAILKPNAQFEIVAHHQLRYYSSRSGLPDCRCLLFQLDW